MAWKTRGCTLEGSPTKERLGVYFRENMCLYRSPTLLSSSKVQEREVVVVPCAVEDLVCCHRCTFSETHLAIILDALHLIIKPAPDQYEREEENPPDLINKLT
jgi:hypothetical protein